MHCQCQELERLSDNQQRSLNAKKTKYRDISEKRKYSQVKGDMTRTKSP